MTKFAASADRDANRAILNSPLPFNTKRTITFAGGTENNLGDYDGTGNPATLFNVTGEVMVTMIGFGKVDLVGATATVECGVEGDTAVLIGQTTAENIVATKVIDAGTAARIVGEFDATSIGYFIIGGGLDIIQTVGTANITAGQIDYYCFWRPISSDGLVSATTD